MWVRPPPPAPTTARACGILAREGKGARSAKLCQFCASSHWRPSAPPPSHRSEETFALDALHVSRVAIAASLADPRDLAGTHATSSPENPERFRRARKHLLGCSFRPSLRAPGLLLPEDLCTGGFAPDDCPTSPRRRSSGLGPSVPAQGPSRTCAREPRHSRGVAWRGGRADALAWAPVAVPPPAWNDA